MRKLFLILVVLFITSFSFAESSTEESLNTAFVKVYKALVDSSDIPGVTSKFDNLSEMREPFSFNLRGAISELHWGEKTLGTSYKVEKKGNYYIWNHSLYIEVNGQMYFVECGTVGKKEVGSDELNAKCTCLLKEENTINMIKID